MTRVHDTNHDRERPDSPRRESTAILTVGGLLLASSLVFFGCSSGSRGGSGSGISGLNSSAAPLPQDGRSYAGPQLDTARYGHTATLLDTGQVLIVGGSDERFLTSLDNAEIFDQSLSTEPIPETISGAFLTTDFSGDPIAMTQGSRVYHTATRLPSGNVLVAGGSRDILVSEATRQAEIFDGVTRRFNPDNLMITNEMVEPRFRHTATLVSGGRVLFVGGQRSVNETIIDPNFPPGHPLFQIDVETFPSTEIIELFDPSALEFRQVLDISGNPAELVTPRGRSDLGTVVMAGMDFRFDTADDVLLHVGGYQTLSSIFAPLTKFPNQLDLDLMEGVEYFDRSTLINASAPAVNALGRANHPQVINLGTFRPDALDGVPGVNNVVLVTNGDDNDLCRVSVLNSEVISTVYTGQGPANGVQFGYQSGDTHLINLELVVADPMTFQLIGRSEAPAVILPAERVYDDQATRSNWVITAGGAHMTCPAEGPTERLSSVAGGALEVQGFMVFDPFYNVAVDPPWNQALSRNQLIGPGGIDLNPSGIVGTWLNHDAIIPDNSLEGYAGPDVPADVAPLRAMRSRRAYHTMTPVPGEDGIPNTFDDRVLLAGGGTSVLQEGGEPVSVSSEVYLPVGANGAQ